MRRFGVQTMAVDSLASILLGAVSVLGVADEVESLKPDLSERLVACDAFTYAGDTEPGCQPLMSAVFEDSHHYATLFLDGTLVWSGRESTNAFIRLDQVVVARTPPNTRTAVFSVSDGGSGCPSRLIALSETEAGVIITPVFGNCHDEPEVIVGQSALHFLFPCGPSEIGATKVYGYHCRLEYSGVSDLVCKGTEFCARNDDDNPAALLHWDPARESTEALGSLPRGGAQHK